ncbi:MAG: acetate--CoA ligase family protein [Pseudomonadota bacterium]
MRDLSRLLRPRSLAVVGGGVWCENIITQSQKIGFEGDIWPVHPKRSTVADRRAFKSISALPGPPDATFIGVNRRATIDVVDDLSKVGAGGAICFASGFQEAVRGLDDGADLQAALISAAGEMPIIGPNCYGLLNYLDNVAIWPDQHGGRPVARGVAIVTQSSNVAINLTMQRRGLPLAYVMTVGNQAQLSWADVGRALLEDERVTSLGLHIEGIGDLRAFEALANEARTRDKPIVALRIGRSDEARSALLSHTASLAGTEAGARALLDRLGIAQVDTLSSFLEVLKLLHITGPLASNHVISFSCSGGEASLVADTAITKDITFPALTEYQKQCLEKVLGPAVALANPLDYHTEIWGDVDAMAEVFAAAVSGTAALGMIVLDFPRADRCDPSAWMPVLTAAEKAARQVGRPFVVVSSLVDTMPEDVANSCMQRGLVPLCGLPEALEAIAVVAKVTHHRQAPPLLLPMTGIGTAPVLSEYEAKQALAEHGLLVPESAIACDPVDAARAAGALGFPVAVKAQNVAHKTEAGGVALNLKTPKAVQAAAETMGAESFLVERMVEGSLVEMLIGVTRDDAHGYVLTLAAGGTLTELLADSASLLVPASTEDIETTLSTLRIEPRLEGYRGSSPINRRALVDAIDAVQAYVAAAHPAEVEINPLMCTREAAWVADALIRRGGGDV